MEEAKTAMYPQEIYEEGDYRKIVPRNQKTNTLLVRPQLGKGKATCYDLPSDDFVYGQQDAVVEAGAAGSVNNWVDHQPNPGPIPNRDFVRLNTYASMNGCTNSKHVAAFRAVNDIRQVPASQIRGGQAYFPPADAVFGRPSPASLPLKMLVQNDYGRQAIAQTRATYAARAAEKPAPRRLQHTKASLGHTKVPAPEPKQPFKMKKFANVGSKALQMAGLNSISSPTARTEVAAPTTENVVPEVAAAAP